MNTEDNLNPYYDADELGFVDKIDFDQKNLSYEFNTLLFVVTPEGEVYSASDSGCSCPKPFEDYEGKTMKEVCQKMERIGSIDQAERIFESWNESIYEKEDRVGISSMIQFTNWIKKHLSSPLS